jgi:hypothetical protein
MNGKKTLIALSAAIALGIMGAASVAQASDHEDQSGGFKIGPLGQRMGGSSVWGARGEAAYGFATPVYKHHSSHTKSELRN